MPGTYVKIQSVTVTGATAANIEFTNIPGTFDDLLIKISLRHSTNGYNSANVSFNGAPSGSSYSGRNIIDYVSGTTSQSTSGASSFTFFYSTGADATASTFASGELYIPNYAGSTNKSFSADSATENNSSAAFSSTRGLAAGLWAQTNAITSIRFTPESGSFVQYSTATLYGIRKS